MHLAPSLTLKKDVCNTAIFHVSVQYCETARISCCFLMVELSHEFHELAQNLRKDEECIEQDVAKRV
jgi:hypothetical protein